MFRFYCIVLVIIFLFIFIACSDGQGIPSETFGDSRFNETAWLYDDTKVREIKVTIDPGYFDKVVWTQYIINGEKKYALAFSVEIDGEIVPNIGIRSRGNTSLHLWKRQFKLSFDATQLYTDSNTSAFVSHPEYDKRRFHGTKKLNLRAGQSDPTIIREKVSSYICQQAGALAPRVGFAKLFINNEYYGLYLLVEQIDKTFLDSRLEEKSGNLYKATWNAGKPSFIPGMENSFELKTNKTENDKSGLTAFFTGLAAANLGSEVAALVDMENVITYLAINALIGHWDSATLVENNDYLYHHSDGKFRFIYWDMDNTLGSDTPGIDILYSNIYQMHTNKNYEVFFDKIMNDMTLKTQFNTKLQSLLDSCFNTTHLNAKINAWKALIESAALADTRKASTWGVDNTTANNQWQQGFTQKPTSWWSSSYNLHNLGLKPWIAARIIQVTSQMATN